MRLRDLVGVGAAGLTIALAGCGGGGSPAGPSNTSPRITAITPGSGSSLGGTTVSIAGANFAAGATVTIGGAAATDVQVSGTTTITAKTPPHVAGAADVVVTVGGQTARLAGAFTYTAAPPVTNTPPVIKQIVAKGSRPNEPSQFADLGEEITVAATVEDAETPLSQLTFEWTAPGGTFTGSGATVTWKAPADFTTPADLTITLLVTEPYQTTDDNGLPVTKENKVTGTTVVQLHDSEREVSGLARQFLLDFIDSSLSASYVVRNFSDSCAGKDAERQDVQDNRDRYTITSGTIGGAETTIAFDGRCPLKGLPGDACAEVPVKWSSTFKANGTKRTDTGTDQLTAIYEKRRWWLCDSSYAGASCTGAACGEDITAAALPGQVR